jgi:ATP-binding cassette subfamily B protein
MIIKNKIFEMTFLQRKKHLKIKQRDIMDCGAACLASISAYYKRYIPVAKIRQYANTDKRGTNFLGMVEAAEKIGFMAKGVKGNYDSLLKIPKPAILHLKRQEQGLLHYVVIYSANAEFVKIMDPATGEIIKVSKEELLKEWTGMLVLLVPDDAFEIGNEKISNTTRLLYLLKPHKNILIQIFFGAVFYSVIGLSYSLYIQKLTDFVFVNGNKNLLNIMSIAMIFLLLIQILLSIFQTIFSLRTGQLIDTRLILGYYKHLLKLPQRFFDTMRSGEIISRINDAVKIRSFINGTMIGLLVNTLIIVVSFILMFVYSWKLALIVLIMVPIYIVLYLISNKLNKKTERKIMVRGAELESQLVESLNTIGTVKRFGIEEFVNTKTENRFVKLLNAGYTSGLNVLFSNTATSFFSSLFTIIVLWAGSHFVIKQELTPGELLSFYAILGYFSGPLSFLISANHAIQNAYIASDRLFEIMDLDQEAQNKIYLTKDMIGDIVFDNISFRYGTRVDVFKKFNLCIQMGKITAIVGESGSGKSTLVHLLQNIYPLSGGKIYIGGVDITHLNNHSIREIVGVIPQKTELFKGSIIDNIAIGEYEPDNEKILKICNSVGLMNFIEQLPDGFLTDVGENGVALSGGQRQKIAFARVLYRQPEIIIMDEATSSMDTQSEEELMNVIHQFRQEGKTIIMIAHRLSTVLHADTIVVMEKGEIVEQGSHHQLYKIQGKYYNLWKKQLPFENNRTDE